MTDVRHLKHFVAVSRASSFRVAANQLGVSQSTMTKSVAALEQAVQLRLFNRTTRRVDLTDTGRELLPLAEAAVKSYDTFLNQARLLSSGEIGALRLGVIALASETLMGDALARLAATHPGLEVDVVVGSEDVYRDLAQGLCDAVVGDEANFAESSHAAGLRMQRLRRENIVVVHRVAHPFGHPQQEGDLLQQPLAIPSRYYNENRLFRQFQGRGGPLKPRYRLNSLSSCLRLVHDSDVISLVPRSVAERAHEAGGIAIADVNLSMSVDFVLVTLAALQPTPGIQVLENALA